jgi:hypothetical protein
MNRIFFVCSVAFWITGLSTYTLYFRNITLLFLKGEQKNTFLQWVVIHLYPRYIVEKHRFDAFFFIQKVDQIVWRLSFGFALIMFFLVISKSYSKISYTKLFYQHSQKGTVLLLIRIYFGLMLYFASDWLWLFYRLSKFSEFYQGVFLLKIFHIPFLPYPFFVLFWSLMTIHILCIICGYRMLINSLLAVFLFVFLQGFLISFYKIDHSYTTFIYVGLWMPFLVLEYQQGSNRSDDSLVLTLIQLTIIQVYLMAGLEKLFTSGYTWIMAENLSGYLKDSASPWGIWLAEYPIACSFLAILALLFELGFGLVLIPRLRYMVLVSGVFFHWGTFVMLGAGGWFSSWVAVYIFFIPARSKRTLAKLELH